MADLLVLADFQPRVGEVFSLLRDGADPVPLELTSAVDLTTPGSSGWTAFGLYFRGPREAMLAQATYEFENPALGRLAIFIVPIGVEPDGYRYEAVFNRRTP
jgi:hypothetical protein